MKQQILPIRELIPIEEELSMKTLKDYIKKPESDILVISLDDKYLVGNGHHRTTAALIRRERTMHSLVLETDEEIRLITKGILGTYNSLDEIRDEYNYNWKPQLELKGIRSFQDYLRIYASQIAEINRALREGL